MINQGSIQNSGSEAGHEVPTSDDKSDVRVNKWLELEMGWKSR